MFETLRMIPQTISVVSKPIVMPARIILRILLYPLCFFSHDWMYNGSRPVDWRRCLRCGAWSVYDPPMVDSAETLALKTSLE
jgi:hypothetical protein